MILTETEIKRLYYSTILYGTFCNKEIALAQFGVILSCIEASNKEHIILTCVEQESFRVDCKFLNTISKDNQGNKLKKTKSSRIKYNGEMSKIDEEFVRHSRSMTVL